MVIFLLLTLTKFIVNIFAINKQITAYKITKKVLTTKQHTDVKSRTCLYGMPDHIFHWIPYITRRP